MRFSNSTVILLSSTGVVVNNAFNFISNETYYIYNNSITNFDNNLWQKIQDPQNLNKSFLITNTNNMRFVATVNLLMSSNSTVSFFLFFEFIILLKLAFYLVILIKSEEIERFLIQFNEERDDNYWTILLIVGFTVFGVIFLAIFINLYISYRIVKPLQNLIKVAAIINKLEKQTTSAEFIKRKLEIYSVCFSIIFFYFVISIG